MEKDRKKQRVQVHVDLASAEELREIKRITGQTMTRTLARLINDELRRLKPGVDPYYLR